VKGQALRSNRVDFGAEVGEAHSEVSGGFPDVRIEEESLVIHNVSQDLLDTVSTRIVEHQVLSILCSQHMCLGHGSSPFGVMNAIDSFYEFRIFI